MTNNIIYIKNMVCPRCIETVSEVFDQLDIAIIRVELGEVELESPILEFDLQNLKEQLNFKGFELLEGKNAKIIGQIKSAIIDQVHHAKNKVNSNFSTIIAEKLAMDYSNISRIFSSVEGITIERYILKQKVEKVKELLFYGEHTLTEIAYMMGYSSVAHLSSQFKKETGMTPSAFKQMKNQKRFSLDSL